MNNNLLNKDNFLLAIKLDVIVRINTIYIYSVFKKLSKILIELYIMNAWLPQQNLII